MTNANRMPITVSKVGHVVLKVSSLDTALDFYSGVLGLKEVARHDFGEGRWRSCPPETATTISAW